MKAQLKVCQGHNVGVYPTIELRKNVKLEFSIGRHRAGYMLGEKRDNRTNELST